MTDTLFLFEDFIPRFMSTEESNSSTPQQIYYQPQDFPRSSDPMYLSTDHFSNQYLPQQQPSQESYDQQIQPSELQDAINFTPTTTYHDILDSTTNTVTAPATTATTSASNTSASYYTSSPSFIVDSNQYQHHHHHQNIHHHASPTDLPVPHHQQYSTPTQSPTLHYYVPTESLGAPLSDGSRASSVLAATPCSTTAVVPAPATTGTGTAAGPLASVVSTPAAQVAMTPTAKAAKKRKRQQQSQETTNEKRYKCDICQKYFRRDLPRHMRTHEEQARFACPFPRDQCNHKRGQFNRPYDFKKHLLHGHFVFDDPQVRTYKDLKSKLQAWGSCTCGQRFQANDWINIHITGESYEGQYLCPNLKNFTIDV